MLNQLVITRGRQTNYSAAKALMAVKSNYGPGDNQWSITSIMQTRTAGGPSKIKAETCLAVIDGLMADGKRHPEEALKINGIPPLFMLKVLSRQACARSIDGKKIINRNPVYGEEDAIVVKYGDLPIIGDVVRCKSSMKAYNEYGERIGTADQESMRMRDIELSNYNEFVIDENGIIIVGYPDVYQLLTKGGERITFPQFKKIDNKDKEKRRITNWLFREVFVRPQAKEEHPIDQRQRNSRG